MPGGAGGRLLFFRRVSLSAAAAVAAAHSARGGISRDTGVANALRRSLSFSKRKLSIKFKLVFSCALIVVVEDGYRMLDAFTCCLHY
jgi:hypothetical protein